MSNYTKARKQSLQTSEQFNLAGAQAMNMNMAAWREKAEKQVIVLFHQSKKIKPKTQ